MRLELITAPGAEPIYLDEARNFSRIDSTADDSLIANLITAARDHAENYTNRALVSQEWQMTLDASELQGSQVVCLPKGNILSISQLSYYDNEDTLIVLPVEAYRLSGNRLALNNGQSWPSAVRDLDAFEIRFFAGYGISPLDVPEAIRNAMKQLISHWYENREAAGDPILPEEQKQQIPFGVNASLQRYKIYPV